MTLIQAIEELLSCKSVSGNTASDAILKESDALAILQKLTLTDLKAGMLVLHIDEGRKVFPEKAAGDKPVAVCMSPLFNTAGIHDYNRGCDAVLVKVSRENDREVCKLLYIELKSHKPAGFAGQFRSTRCFFRYVKALIEEFWELEMNITSERFVVFHTDASGNRTRGKQPTRFSSNNANSPEEPQRYVVRNNDIVRCTELF